MKKTILSLIAAATLSACAQAPEAVVAIPLGNIYADTTCPQAQNMLTTETQTLAQLSAQQRSAQTGDTIGVILIGVPVSSLGGGDVSGQIAASKGKMQALQMRLARC